MAGQAAVYVASVAILLSGAVVVVHAAAATPPAGSKLDKPEALDAGIPQVTLPPGDEPASGSPTSESSTTPTPPASPSLAASPAVGTLPPATSSVRPPQQADEVSDDSSEEYDYLDGAAEAIADAVQAIFPLSVLSQILESDEQQDSNPSVVMQTHGESKDGDDDSDEDDCFDELFGWFDLFRRRRRRRSADDAVPPANALGAELPRVNSWLRAKEPQPKEDENFLKIIKKIFNRARRNVLARQKTTGLLVNRKERVKDNLTAMASRALNVTQAEVTRAFGGMASRWVGEALFEFLFEDEDDDSDVGASPGTAAEQDDDDDLWNLNWDAGVNMNGSFNVSGNASSPITEAGPREGVRRARQQAAPEQGDGGTQTLNSSAVAYFLVELLGTVAGLSYGAWYAIAHSG